MLRYEIILHWSQEDRAFIAEVPELPGCAADGETYQEALQNVEVIMQEWIETAQEPGYQINNGIEKRPHTDFSGTTSRFRWWNQRFNQFILFKSQIAGVCFSHNSYGTADLRTSSINPVGFFTSLYYFENSL